MDQKIFDLLLQNLKEAAAISHGEMPASRRTVIAPPNKKHGNTTIISQTGLTPPTPPKRHPH